MVFESCGEIRIGVFQFQRSGGSPRAGTGRIDLRSLLTRSMREMLPSCDSA